MELVMKVSALFAVTVAEGWREDSASVADAEWWRRRFSPSFRDKCWRMKKKIQFPWQLPRYEEDDSAPASVTDAKGWRWWFSSSFRLPWQILKDEEDDSSPAHGYLGSAPDLGRECRASISPKNTGEMSKTILFNQYDESEWWSLITNQDKFKSN